MTWKRYNWLSDGLVPLLIALLRVLWLTPWLELLRRWVASDARSPILSPFVILALLASSIVLARLVLDAVPNLALDRAIVAGAGFAAIALAIWWQFYRSSYGLLDGQWLATMGKEMTGWEGSLPGPFVALPVVIYLWLQGIMDGREVPDRDGTWRSFIRGFLALALCAIAASLTHQATPAGMSNVVILFFATGMAALALSSIEATRDAGAHGSEGQITVNRYWLASVASVIVVLLALGLLLSALFAPDVVARLLSWTSRLMDVLGTVVYYVVLVVAYLVFALLGPLIDLLQSKARENPATQQLELTDLSSQLKDIEKGTAALPPAVGELLRWLGLALLILGIAAIFALALRRFARRRDEAAGETRESILTRDLLSRQLSALLRNRLRGRGQAGEPLNPFLSLEGEPDTRRQIRRAYQSLLETMIQRGRPRRREQTPREYQDDVQSELPAEQVALSVLTDGYVQARYAARPPERSLCAEAVRQAWEQIRKSLEPKQPADAGADPAPPDRRGD